MSPHFSMKTKAPAKLNIFLKITGKRPDGYHELVSIMVPVALFDYLEFTLSQKPGIRLSCQGLFIPDGEDNLVQKAAKAFFFNTGIDQGIDIEILKNIPVAAGLGGGSSDAAVTLMALNEMSGFPLSDAEMEKTALSLGADVPFFLKGVPCLAKGIGEDLSPFENLPRFWYLIVKPPFDISTAWVYARLKLELTEKKHDYIINYLKKEPFEVVRHLENDLERVTIARFSAIDSIKKSLLNAGAEGALMSGSGSSVFGVFNSKDDALKAKRQLSPQCLGDIFVVQGIC